MNTRERVALLASVVAQFPEMGTFGDESALLELIRLELGSETALDEGQVSAPRKLLHIISGNTAMAGMQSLVRGLILGSKNWCKLPGGGLPMFEEFVSRLPMELRAMVEVSSVLRPNWLETADAVVVFGSDATVKTLRKLVREDQIFVGYGSRWSGAVIFSDSDFSSVVPLVKDVSLYDQMGCLSAQIVWLHESIDVVEYGEKFSTELERYVKEHLTAKLGLEDASSISRWRSTAEWKTSTDGHIWLSKGEPVFGVVFSNLAPGLSCLHRHVTLVRFSEKPELGDLASSVSTLGLWPDSPENRLQLASSGASRFCKVGEMQFPSPTWQQDGAPGLGRLVQIPSVG